MAQPLDIVLVFSGDSSKAIAAVTKLSTTVQALDKTVAGLKKASSTAAAGGTSAFQSWTKVFSNMQAVLVRTVDSFRLVSQGIMSVGRALTFFISLPLAAAFGAGTEAAMTFEDQMIRVRKTAGLTSEQLEDLTERIRGIARSAPTSHEQLGIMAEQAGQLGIVVPEAIAKYVQWMEILATSTNISADEVVSTMGKISSAFGWNINKSVEEVIRLSNVLNALENTTAATAGEIADALFRFAPQAKQLGITAADAAALAAGLISLGVSAESTGTRLGTMYVQLARNSDKFAELASNTEKYRTQADVLNALNEDAVDVLFDLITMMGEEDNKAQALAEAFDLVGMRGGRALGTLAQNSELLRGAMATARQEWLVAQSLVTEYNIALDSAKSHMQIFKNNVTDVGIELGRTLLPAINEIIEIAVPALRMLGKYIRSLSKEQQMWIVIIGAIIIALGPLTFLLSQIAFGIFMVGLGIIKFLEAGGLLIKAIGSIAAAFGALNASWLVTIALLIGGIAILKNIFVEQADKIAEFFRGLAAEAKTWGENLAANIGVGLVAGAVRFIAAALEWIGNLIASFLESHSPPKLGPLSHIDKWGIALMDTYLAGMKKADFGILKDVGSVIGNILKNFAVVGKVSDDNQFIFLMEARQNLAKLLDLWRKTGKVSEETLNAIVRNLGNAADEVKVLIRLNLKLIEVEDRLRDLQKRREDFLDYIDEEIKKTAVSNASAETRVELIRKLLRERDQGLRDMNEEEKGLEKQKDLAEEQLETQKAMIAAMQEQDDLQARLIKTLEKLSGSMEEGFKLPPIDASGLNLPDPEDIANALGEPIIELELKFKSKEGVLQGLFAGLRGEDWGAVPPEIVQQSFGVNPEDLDLFYRFNDVGLTIRDTVDGIREKFDSLKDALTGASDSLSGLNDTIQTFRTDNEDLLNTLTAIAAAIAAFATLKGIIFLAEAFLALVTTVQEFGGIVGLVTTLLSGIPELLIPGITAVAAALGTSIGVVLGFLIGIPVLIFLIIKYGKTAWNTLVMLVKIVGMLAQIAWRKLSEWWAKITDTWSNNWELLKEIVSKAWENITKRIKDFFAKAGKFFKDGWENIKKSVDDARTRIITAAKNLIKRVVDFFKKGWERLKMRFKISWFALLFIISSVSQRIKDTIKRVFNNVVDWLSSKLGIDMRKLSEDWKKIWEAIGVIVSTIWERIKTRVKEILGTIWTAIVTAAQNTWDSLTRLWGGLVKFAQDTWSKIRTAVSEAVDKVVTWIKEKWEVFTTWIAGIWEKISTKASEIWESVRTSISEAVTAAAEWLTTKWDEITSWLSTTWETIRTNAEEIWDSFVIWITGIAESMWSAITTALNPVIADVLAIWTQVQTDVTTTWEAIRTAIEEKATEITTAIRTKIQEWITEFTTTVQQWIDAGKAIIKGLADGMWANAGKLISTVTAIVKKAVKAAGNFFGIDLTGILGGDEEDDTPGSYKGGIVTSPSKRWIAEREPEAVLPLSKVPNIFGAILNQADMLGPNTGPGRIEVNFNNPVVRDDRDLRAIIAAVEKALSEKVLRQASYGGSINF